MDQPARRLSADTCTQLLINAVRIPSLSGEEQALAGLLVHWAAQHGYTRAVVDQVGNAVCQMGPDDATRTLVLLGHMDTVPGQVPVRVEEGKLYGRGTVDAKGPLCAFLCAVARVGPLPHTRLVVVGAVEEESATSRGARHIRDRFLQAGIPDACIIGEPSGWDRVTLGYKGRLLVDFSAQQESAHTAGEGALGVADRACRWWESIKSLCEEHNRSHTRIFDQILPSLRQVNTASDGLHERVHARVGLRLPPHADRQALQAQIAALAQAVGGTVSFFGYEPAYRADRHTPLVRAFTAAIRAVGGRPGFKVKTGTSDMNVVGPAWQCPILAYGPGNSSLDHTPHEHILLDEYLRSIRVLETALVRWASAAPGESSRRKS